MTPGRERHPAPLVAVAEAGWGRQVEISRHDPRPPFLLSARAGGNRWLRHPGVIDAWKRGAQLDVPPLTMEFAPILSCDAGCPLCPFGRARSHLADGERVTTPVPCDDVHATSWATTRKILEAARAAGVEGVLFTGGGEPDLWDYLPDALSYAADLGMDACVYTNGARLGVDKVAAGTLLARQDGLAFVRVSLNAVTAPVARRHWGAGFDVEEQFEGLRQLLIARSRLAAGLSDQRTRLPSIQISTIIDHHNLGDLAAICDRVAKIFLECAEYHGAGDLMVVRPLVVHGRATGFRSRDHAEATIHRIIDLAGGGSAAQGVLAHAGVALVLGYGLNEVKAGLFDTYAHLIGDEYAWRSSHPVNLANGLFLTVGPTGRVYPGTDYNCDDSWAIGSLKEQTVEEIYRSTRRAEVLSTLNHKAWQACVAQPFSRTNRLARIAAAVCAGDVDDDLLQRLRHETAGQDRGILLD